MHKGINSNQLLLSWLRKITIKPTIKKLVAGAEIHFFDNDASLTRRTVDAKHTDEQSNNMAMELKA